MTVGEWLVCTGSRPMAGSVSNSILKRRAEANILTGRANISAPAFWQMERRYGRPLSCAEQPPLAAPCCLFVGQPVCIFFRFHYTHFHTPRLPVALYLHIGCLRVRDIACFSMFECDCRFLRRSALHRKAQVPDGGSPFVCLIVLHLSFARAAVGCGFGVVCARSAY